MEKFTGKVWVLDDDIDRFRKATLLLQERTLDVVLPENRHRKLSKHWEFSV